MIQIVSRETSCCAVAIYFFLWLIRESRVFFWESLAIFPGFQPGLWLTFFLLYAAVGLPGTRTRFLCFITISQREPTVRPLRRASAWKKESRSIKNISSEKGGSCSGILFRTYVPRPCWVEMNPSRSS